MKKCPYCGKEYPDDATNCAVDNELLLDDSSRPVIVGKQEDKAAPPKAEPHLAFPEYKWSARDAWKCIGLLICAGFVLFAIDQAAYLKFAVFLDSGPGFACLRVLTFATWVITACYFARTETLATIWEAFGLNRKPTKLVWFGMAAAVILNLIEHFVFIHGYGKGVATNYPLTSLKDTMGYERWFFAFSPLVLAPIFEEPVNRGFLYKAFRGSYSVAVSTILIMVWVYYTHWSQCSTSWIAALVISAITIVICYLREKSASLWDCILSHFVFNASALFW